MTRFIIISGLIVSVIVFVWFVMTKKFESEKSTTGSNNWVTYTDPHRTYSFDYPADVFVWQDEPYQLKGPLESSQKWADRIVKQEKEAIFEPTELIEGKYKFLNTWHYMDISDTYDTILAMSIGDRVDASIGITSTKIADLDTQRIKGAITEDMLEGRYYGYEAVWIRKPCVYRVAISIYDKDALASYQPVFDRMVKSMQFLPKPIVPTDQRARVLCATEEE